MPSIGAIGGLGRADGSWSKRPVPGCALTQREAIETPNPNTGADHDPLPTPSTTTRPNALAAAAIVTLTLLAGIDSRAINPGAAPQLAQAGVTLPG